MLLNHPEWNRTCNDCLLYQHNDDTGEIVMLGTERMRRPQNLGVSVPCFHCAKIPKKAPKHWDHAIELTDQNWQAYTHWKQCRAVNQFPDDPIVRRNAAIISDVYEEYQKAPIRELTAILIARKVTDGG